MKISRLLAVVAAAAAMLCTNFVVAGQPELSRSARAQDDVCILAASDMAGRRTGSDGSRKAQAFLQTRFATLGLKPFGAAYARPFSIKAPVTPGQPHASAYPSAVNYIGYLAGSARPERFIVVSAHYDHLGIKNGVLYPGADDNASGVAAMLAIAAWFKEHPPRHSIVFAAFDGEELGLQGARAFLAALPFAKAQLALNLNLDMVSRNDRNQIYVAGTRYAPHLTPLVTQAAARSSVDVKFGHDRPQLQADAAEDWTDASDHGPFHEAGVPFLYFGVEEHAGYHAPGDTFEHINHRFFAGVVDLLVDVAATLDAELK